MGKKLFFITTRLFWPTDSGRKVSLYYYCKGLHEKYGYDIYLYSFLENGQKADLALNKPDFIKEVHLAKKISMRSKLTNLLLKSFLTFKWPLQCSLFYSNHNKKLIYKNIKQINPDVIMVDMIRLAPYFDAFKQTKCLKVLDMDDLLSKRYERQLKSRTNASVAGQYSVGMSSILNKFLGLKLIKNSILCLEKKLMCKAELYYGKKYDKVVFVSQNECDELNKFITDKAYAVPLGIHKDQFISCTYNPGEENKLCFIGNMAVAANVDTLYMIVTQILPRIKARVSLQVIGKCPDDLRKLYKTHKEITFTGRVDVIYDYAKECKLFLAPIAYGSGIKTKILEAMAMQLPVITNSIGAEGLNMINKKHYIVEDDYDAIAKAVDYYLSNKVEAEAMAKEGQQIVFQKYEWNEIWKQFKDILPIAEEIK